MRQLASLLLSKSDADGKGVAAVCQGERAIIIAAAVAQSSVFVIKGEQWHEKNVRLLPSHEWRRHGDIVCSQLRSDGIAVMTKCEGFIFGDNHGQSQPVSSFAQMACHGTDITLALAGMIEAHHDASGGVGHEGGHQADTCAPLCEMSQATVGACSETRPSRAKKVTGGGFMRESFG